jgi:hypothetical protein
MRGDSSTTIKKWAEALTFPFRNAAGNFSNLSGPSSGPTLIEGDPDGDHA